MRSRLVRPGGAVVTALSLAVLVACGGSSSGTPKQGDASAGGGSAGSKTLTVAWASTPPQLDPNVFTGLTWLYANDAYMATLLKYDTSVDPSKIIGVKDLKP